MFNDWGHVGSFSTDNTCCFVDFIAVLCTPLIYVMGFEI